ncbi:MAG: serpin family protein [Porticoccus sp.]|nr:serpin family protein [Porticoccus sp.]
MRRFNFTLALAILPLLIGGCAEQQKGEQSDSAYIETFPANGLRKSPDALQPLTPINPTTAHHDFAFADFQSNTPFDENTLSAPFDLQQLLATVALGADGTTLEAFSTASGFDLSDVSTYAGISIWEQQIEAFDGVERQRFLWGQRQYGFAATYLQTQTELFGPVMSGLDFVGDPFSSQTLIDDTLGNQLSMNEIGSRTRLVAAQTTQLETGWAASSSIENVSGRFGPHYEQRWVDMARVTGMHPTTFGDNYQAVEVALADPGLSMVMITPAPGQFDNVRRNLDATLWADIRGQLDATTSTAESSIYVPKFVLTREVTNDNMPDLGVALTDDVPLSVITDGTFPVIVVGDDTTENITPSGPEDPDTAANFSRVNNAGFLYLDVPRQHITLNVDEQGLNTNTITSAVHTATNYEPGYLLGSGIGGGDSGGLEIITQSSTQPCFYPSEQAPFLFAIFATASNTLLHLGQVRALDGPLVDADWTVPKYIWSCGLTPPVEIYKHSGAKQCEPGSGISIFEMGRELGNAGIAALESREGSDGQIYIALCGSPDGTINIFTIDETQVPLAEMLGFSRL